MGNKKLFFEECLIPMYQEFEIAKNLSHPNIVEYKYFVKKYDKPNDTYKMHMLLEFLEGGDLGDYIQARGKVSLPMIRQIGGQLLGALSYLHSLNIVHQDIKPKNIVFKRDQKTVKFIDLGVSHMQVNSLKKLVGTQKNVSLALQGSPLYRSPEQNKLTHSRKMDIWALGCVLLQCATGQKPWHKSKAQTEK